MRAIMKLSGEKEPKCVICGCPHVEILHIGHIEHRAGRFLRKETDVVPWILMNPIEVVRAEVQLECPFCNAWHNKFKEFPPEDKRPKW